MQEFPDLASASAHRFKPMTGDGAKFSGLRFHPGVYGRVPLDRAVESQECFLHLTIFAAGPPVIGACSAISRNRRRLAFSTTDGFR